MRRILVGLCSMHGMSVSPAGLDCDTGTVGSVFITVGFQEKDGQHLVLQLYL